MKPIELERNGLLAKFLKWNGCVGRWRIATQAVNYPEFLNNSCALGEVLYPKILACILFPIFWLSVVTASIATVLYSVVAEVTWIYYTKFQLDILPPDSMFNGMDLWVQAPAILGLCLQLVFAILVLAISIATPVLLSSKYLPIVCKKLKSNMVKQPTIVKLAHSIKENYCIPIIWKNKEK